MNNENNNYNDFFIRLNKLPELNTLSNSHNLNKSHNNFFTTDDIQVGEK